MGAFRSLKIFAGYWGPKNPKQTSKYTIRILSLSTIFFPYIRISSPFIFSYLRETCGLLANSSRKTEEHLGNLSSKEKMKDTAKWEDVSFSTLTVWSKRQLALASPWRVHRQVSRRAPGVRGSSANSRNHCSTRGCCCRVIPVPLGSPECIKLTLFPGKAKCLRAGWCSIIMDRRGRYTPKYEMIGRSGECWFWPMWLSAKCTFSHRSPSTECLLTTT